jgi:hypothetical protein
MGEYGAFNTEQERDEWVAERDRAIAEEAERLKGIGITGADDLAAKYADLCNLYETVYHTGETEVHGEMLPLTSDSARAFADKVLEIMHGGPWRSETR